MAGAPLERILVTGASGFVGPYLVAALQEAFGSAQIISASPTAAPLPGTLPVHLDLADLAAPRALVEAMRPQACLHLAAVSHIGHALESPGSAWRINLLGALALAEAMQDIAQWGEVTFIVHTADAIFEFTGPVPNGEVGRGYFNLMQPKGLHGHLRHDRCAAVAFVERPFMGKSSAFVAFLNVDGGVMFKVFVGRDEVKALRQDQLDRFRALAERFGAVSVR